MLARKQGREVIAGHTRLKALAYLEAHKRVDGVWVPRTPEDGPYALEGAPGPGFVPCRLLDLTADEAHALALADNRTAELADWDDDALGKLLAEMRDGDVALDDMGWGDDELQRLIDGSSLVQEHRRTKPGDDAPEVQTVVHSRPGVVYELGPHRAMCGDSTSAEVWAALMQGEKARGLWSDPPYGVAYVGKTADALTIENDNLDEGELEALLRAALGLAFEHCEPGASWYVSAPPGPINHVFGGVLRDLGVWRWTLQWVKDRFVLGRADYHHRHEPIFYGWKPGAAHYFVDDRTQDTVFEVPRPGRSPDHPTTKPIALVTRQLANSAKSGWIVADPFGGSGTTLLACADLGLVCRTIELDPRYCDVIRRRYTTWALANDLDPGPGRLDP